MNEIEPSHVIYLNGEKRLSTPIGDRFFIDSDSLPGRRCSQHSLKPESVAHLRAGGAVYTSGNWYSLTPMSAERLKKANDGLKKEDE